MNEVDTNTTIQPTSKNNTKRYKTQIHFRKFPNGTVAPTTGSYYQDENGAIRRDKSVPKGAK